MKKFLLHIFCIAAFCVLSFLVPLHAQIIITVVGNGTIGFIDGVPATAAEIEGSPYVCLDSTGKMYIPDQGNRRVRTINTSGIISTIAGTGVAGFGGDGFAATLAQMQQPSGVAADGAGNVYFSDESNYRIRKVDASGIITTIAGTASAAFYGDSGPATLAKFNAILGIILDGSGNLYVADNINGRIRKISLATGGIVTTVAGSSAVALGDGGPATAANLYQPTDIALDGAGNLYIADENNNRIRKVDNTTGIISTIAGNGLPGYTGDGVAATATELNSPWGVAVDGCGNVYIGDFNNNRLRKVDISGIITTVAGNGTGAFGGDGGPATAALLSAPAGVKTDRKGNIFIADAGNWRIRMISSTNHAPYFTGGHTQSFTACSDSVISVDSLLAIVDSDLNQGETWSIWSAPAHGMLTAAYTTISTGSKLTPSGLSYIASGGYSGNDSFKVIISDCADLHDTAVVYVTVKSCPLSVLNYPHSTLEISPNPNHGNFSMYVPSYMGGAAQVVISNQTGEKVKEISMDTNQATEIQLDSPPGIYFLSVTTFTANWIRKIVIVK